MIDLYAPMQGHYRSYTNPSQHDKIINDACTLLGISFEEISTPFNRRCFIPELYNKKAMVIHLSYMAGMKEQDLCRIFNYSAHYSVQNAKEKFVRVLSRDDYYLSIAERFYQMHPPAV